MSSSARTILLIALLSTGFHLDAFAVRPEANIGISPEGVITVTGDGTLPAIKELEDGSIVMPEAKEFPHLVDFIAKHGVRLSCPGGYWGISHPSRPNLSPIGIYDSDQLFLTARLKGNEKGPMNVLRIEDQYAIGFYFQYACEAKKHMKPDYEEGFKWLQRAAKFGNANAQHLVGVAFRVGRGTEKDEVAAAKWDLKSAEQGIVEAQLALGFAYILGQGVPKDEVEAYAFFNIAGANNEDARKYVARLEGEMSQSARLAGQQRSRQLLQEFEAKKDSLRQLIEDSKKAREKKGA
jgi:hypothetical protein